MVWWQSSIAAEKTLGLPSLFSLSINNSKHFLVDAWKFYNDDAHTQRLGKEETKNIPGNY